MFQESDGLVHLHVANLLIRNLDPALHARLRQRDQLHHHSLEVEVRETLRTAIAREAGTTQVDTLVDIAARAFGSMDLALDLPPRGHRPTRPPPDFAGPEYDR